MMSGYDKVVCIDDANLLADFFDWPNGGLRLGRIYCVTGWSKCGGLVLAGLPAIFKRNGHEAGFRRERFCPLEHFRTVFARSYSLTGACAEIARLRSMTDKQIHAAYWYAFPETARERLLNRVFCAQCRVWVKGLNPVPKYSASGEERDVLFYCACSRCGHKIIWCAIADKLNPKNN